MLYQPSKTPKKFVPAPVPALSVAVIFVALLLLLIGFGRSSALASEPQPLTQGVEEPSRYQAGDSLTTVAPSIVVCLDAGHGAIDGGCKTEERLEKDDNMRLALAIQSSMEDAGITVVMTRTLEDDEADHKVKLDERCEIANSSGADFFISIHRNTTSDTSASTAKGVEVWRSHLSGEEASLLGENILSRLEEVGISKNRGVSKGSQGSQYEDYYVLQHTSMTSVLVEMGFMQNDDDNWYFDTNLESYADAFTQAVLDTYATLHADDTAN
jgi:N-acetylmuramoyl-L-alanine amidase